MDRISGLSDELLIKILLLVPTRVAVSTSILSKRWENLWMWLPKLEYGLHRYCPESDCKRMQSFLNRNMSLHRAPVIESFRLDLCGARFSFSPENINTWIVIAVSHCLRELEILYDYYEAKSNILPSSLFTCKSLVTLKLDGGILLDVPRMVSLPCLKTLKLQRVKYFNKKTLQRLLSNCPILEDLVVKLRNIDILRRLTIVVPSLQSLSIYVRYAPSIDGFVIETPDLKYFKLRFHSYDDESCLIANMPYLIEAHLDFDLHFLKGLMGSTKSLKDLIGPITSVKRLTLCSQTMLDEGFVFNRLEYLELCLCTPLVPDQLFLLLRASPKLNRIDISLIDGHLCRDMVYWNQPTTVPECLLSSLQSLSWSKYTGNPQERDVVVYILKHAAHLKTATIKSSESAVVPKFEMLKELALSSRASAACHLTFE